MTAAPMRVLSSRIGSRALMGVPSESVQAAKRRGHPGPWERAPAVASVDGGGVPCWIRNSQSLLLGSLGRHQLLDERLHVVAGGFLPGRELLERREPLLHHDLGGDDEVELVAGLQWHHALV